MANINTELATIATSIYGSDMRQAIHDGLKTVSDTQDTDEEDIDLAKHLVIECDEMFYYRGWVEAYPDAFFLIKDLNVLIHHGTVYFRTWPERTSLNEQWYVPTQADPNVFMLNGTYKAQARSGVARLEIRIEWLNPTSTQGDYQTLFTLPEGWAPKENTVLGSIYPYAVPSGSTSVTYERTPYIAINTNGDVIFYNCSTPHIPFDTGSVFFAVGTYFLEDEPTIITAYDEE